MLENYKPEYKNTKINTSLDDSNSNISIKNVESVNLNHLASYNIEKQVKEDFLNIES